MSQLEAVIKNGVVTVRVVGDSHTHDSFSSVNIDELVDAARRTFQINLKAQSDRYKILLTKQLPDKSTIVVFTDDREVHCYRHRDLAASPYKRLVHLKSHALSVFFTKRKLYLMYVAVLVNPYRLSVTKQAVYIDENNIKKSNINVLRTLPSKISILFKNLHVVSFSVDKLTSGKDIPINSNIKVQVEIDGEKAQYDIHKRSRSIEMEKKHRKFYYAPIASVRTSKFSLNVRRANGGALVLARRPREAVEYQHLFLFIDSPIVSWVLYWTAKLTRTVSTRRVAIYFEKNANGAEEGTFESQKWPVARAVQNTTSY